MKCTERPIIQPSSREGWCGPDALHHVLQCLGILASHAALADLAGTTDTWGTTHQGMVAALEAFGVRAQWGVYTLEQCAAMLRRGERIIVNYMDGRNSATDGHYGVLRHIDAKTVWIDDPTLSGRITILRREDFERLWFDIDQDGTRLDHEALRII